MCIENGKTPQRAFFLESFPQPKEKTPLRRLLIRNTTNVALILYRTFHFFEVFFFVLTEKQAIATIRNIPKSAPNAKPSKNMIEFGIVHLLTP